MSKKAKKHREHWYSGITEAFQMYLPGSKIYHTIPARRARVGVLFILPFIIGFIAFMVKPLIISLRMSFSQYTIKTGEMVWNGLVEIGNVKSLEILEGDPFVAETKDVTDLFGSCARKILTVDMLDEDFLKEYEHDDKGLTKI